MISFALTVPRQLAIQKHLKLKHCNFSMYRRNDGKPPTLTLKICSKHLLLFSYT